MSTLMRVRSLYGRFLKLCGLFAGLMTFAVMCLVVTNVVLRYLFNSTVPGTFELTEGALPLIIFLSLALTQFHGGHIRVVVLTQSLPEPVQRVLGIIAMLAGAVLFAWAPKAGWTAFAKSVAINEIERGSIRYPLAPVRFAIFFGMVLLTVQFLLDALTLALGGRLADAHGDEVEP
ncbi:TRAP-type C4-dicarboxylate transport system, small permease component [Roseivivax marinus]|uniref:TRAP transporter small permease subunit n=1 Tax=Roseivivax marinus TaxID=1379903 RepID=UPI0008B90D51|nr:TRAP transporter small permease [Roseivivax marinus]SEL29191.1 TRAP-type C4-dicarboxylate transport system, small permease component [Roseivivax marinus]